MAAVDESRLGAWVLKCNPDVWDLEGFLADGERHIDNWSVAENYRSAMMQHGQPVLFWVSGSRRKRLPPGLWGSGWVIGSVGTEVVEVDREEPDAGEPTEGDQAERADYWLDEQYRVKARFFVPVALQLWDAPVEVDALRSVAGLAGMELLRQPQMSNPSWLTTQELAAVEPLLPSWPDLGSPLDEEINVGPSGAYGGDPVVNAVVERAAVAAVTADYEQRGWTVRDVSAKKLGWDLECTRSQTDRVEVKGLSGRATTVLLTANEIRAAREQQRWRLAVVTRALTSPALSYYGAADAVAAAEPYVYRARL